jgi:hypothetical protein
LGAYQWGTPRVRDHQELNRRYVMVKVIETVLLGPGEVCCDALGVSQENNRDLVRMLINSLIWTAVGGIFIAIVV